MFPIFGTIWAIFWKKNTALVEKQVGASVDKLITFMNLSGIFLT